MSKIKKSELLARIESLEKKLTEGMSTMQDAFYNLGKLVEHTRAAVEKPQPIDEKLEHFHFAQEQQAEMMAKINYRLDTLEAPKPTRAKKVAK